METGKAFLQIRTRENERDFLTFQWSEKVNYGIIKDLSVYKANFRVKPVVICVIGNLKNTLWKLHRDVIERVKDDMYVDDLVTCGEKTSEVYK